MTTIDSIFYERKLSFDEFKEAFISLCISEAEEQGINKSDVLKDKFINKTIENIFELYEINWSQINE